MHTLQNWNPYKHPNHPNEVRLFGKREGERVITSAVVSVRHTLDGMIVTTESGSEYFLGAMRPVELWDGNSWGKSDYFLPFTDADLGVRPYEIPTRGFENGFLWKVHAKDGQWHCDCIYDGVLVGMHTEYSGATREEAKAGALAKMQQRFSKTG